MNDPNVGRISTRTPPAVSVSTLPLMKGSSRLKSRVRMRSAFSAWARSLAHRGHEDSQSPAAEGYDRDQVISTNWSPESRHLRINDKFYKVEAETGTGLGEQSQVGAAVRDANAWPTPRDSWTPQTRNFEAMYRPMLLSSRTRLPMWTKIQPTVPAFATEALRRGSVFYGGLSMPFSSRQPVPRRPRRPEVRLMEKAVVSVGGQPLNRPPRPGEQIELTVEAHRHHDCRT